MEEIDKLQLNPVLLKKHAEFVQTIKKVRFLQLLLDCCCFGVGPLFHTTQQMIKSNKVVKNAVPPPIHHPPTRLRHNVYPFALIIAPSPAPVRLNLVFFNLYGLSIQCLLIL